MSEWRAALALAAGAACSLAAHAADVRPLLKAGYDFDGDRIAFVEFTDDSTASIKANEGFYVGGGAAIINDARDWELHVTLAYKFATIQARNGDVDWTRFPFEVLAFYRFEKLRLGGGLAYHINPRLDGSGAASNVQAKFKDALGAVLQADWRITQTIAAGLRYTVLEYDAKAPLSGSAKADGLGLTFSMNF